MIELDKFGYDLIDVQDGLKCWRLGFIFCGKHHLLLTRMQVSDIGLMGPLFTIVTVKVESVPDFYTWANGKKLAKSLVESLSLLYFLAS